MENGQQQTAKGLDPIRILVVFVVLVVLGIAVWYGYSKIHKSTSNKAVNSSSASWTEFKSEKYGFKFDYPSIWGSPSIAVASNNSSSQAAETTKQTGESYVVTFSNPNVKSDRFATITIDSSDYSIIDCVSAQDCSTTPGYNAARIKSRLSFTKGLWKYDSDSISDLTYSNGSGVVTISRIVSLPKIKADAAITSYTLTSASPSCTRDSLSNASTDCVSQTDYDNLSRVAKSIKAV